MRVPPNQLSTAQHRPPSLTFALHTTQLVLSWLARHFLSATPCPKQQLSTAVPQAKAQARSLLLLALPMLVRCGHVLGLLQAHDLLRFE